ncbi:hypothetical protein N3K66_003617 [Trichothecium roseum]|uniref:Uncharacterized protein n=1 Tax=Trichothecium roseum TaxID=47278 RepID=A0ACC0V607_9HYPO|nr:hypothetical protein N3K66_003617 [Trichothecium roseum]
MYTYKVVALAAMAAFAEQAVAFNSHRHLHEHAKKAEPTTREVKSLTKRGVAYNDAGLANTFGAACEKCSWAYNWASLPGNLDQKFEYMPTLWGDIDIHTSHWDSDVEQCLASGTKVLFSFNEPDHASQSNMSPEQAASAHNRWMNKYAGRAQVCAPSVTNSGNPGEGLDWLRNFHNACNNIEGGCAIDCCNIHWYSEAAYSDTLFTHIDGAKEICGGKPIYLTEFAPLGSDDDKNGFMSNIISRLDGVDGLAGYSYFMVAEGNLMSSANDLSSYGRLYATV